MKELIKEADEMYDKLMRVIRHINTPEFDKDDSIAIIEASQLLRRLVERKDNIVDLSEVWHKYNSKQEICGDIIARYKDNILVGVHSQCDIDIFLRHNRHLEGKIYFAFVKDLLPKGDSK